MRKFSHRKFADRKPKSVYDLFNIIMIHIGDDDDTNDTLIKFLRLVFLKQLTEKELTQKLQDEFGMNPNEETRKELTIMCNLSIGLKERAKTEMILNMIKEHLHLDAIERISGWTADQILALAQKNGLAVE